MSNLNIIIEVLQELRIAAKVIKSEEDLKATMRKYDMLFLGGEFNTIYARELRHCLEKVFDKEIPINELLGLVPDVCGALGMKTEAMVFVDDPDRKIADYQITLF